MASAVCNGGGCTGENWAVARRQFTSMDDRKAVFKKKLLFWLKIFDCVQAMGSDADDLNGSDVENDGEVLKKN